MTTLEPTPVELVVVDSAQQRLMTQRYNRRRGQLDRNSTHLVTAFLAAG